MKKIRSAVLLLAFCYACGSGPAEEKKPISLSVNPQIGEGQQKTTAAEGGTTGSATAAAPALNGKALLEASDCRACHHDKDKLVGPAYADVAKKYKEKDIPMLGKKILEGGAGNWGQIPMAPHPTLSEQDAEAMAKYILTIK
ncbi:MAG: c-type cytochrome [Bacteroidetes bacterium]|nr:c-type cytochrome [Bacteroidota bacterium]